ncbi:MAG: class I SAM-dependent methyltransferase [Thaumarchaeota archaeon]|nr:class I SAM-dependent methyltransferase [Nitrososphaerota archaeon]
MDKAEEVISEIEKQGQTSFLPVIGPKKGKILDDIVKGIKPKLVVEVGTFIGYSAIRMARLLPNDGKIFSIEIDKKYAHSARKNIARAGLQDKIQVILGDAKKVLPAVKGKIDLLFLDAEKHEYLTYLRLAEDKLHKGSVVVADNAGVFATEMSDYLSYVRKSERYSSTYYESTLEFMDHIKDGVEVSIRLLANLG